MKSKTEAKRQAILDVATQAFRELGYERTSMSEIRARVGGSKATLYNYFKSKEELFFESIFLSIEDEFEAVHSALDANSENIRESLYNFGERFLTFLYAPDMFANRKLTITESARTNLGKIAFERGLSRSHGIIENFLSEAIKLQKLKECDVVVATKHLCALLESEILMQFLMNVKNEISADEIKEITKRAVDVFILAYGVCK
ncbi:MAG: hypothetical protein RL154_863 [Pseudomonadota bacterium]|jgi:AcrR family transcriptional regulator